MRLCREYLDFAIHLSTVGSAEEKTEKLELCLTKLGLQSCADTIVGNEFQKGLSGGQVQLVQCEIGVLSSVVVRRSVGFLWQWL